MRVLVVTHHDIAYSETRYDHELVAGLGEITEVVIAEWEHMTSPSAREAARVADADLASFDVCMVYVRIRFRFEAEPWDWSGFDGLRVWMEHDAWGDYSSTNTALRGRFASVYRRDGFHLMISTGCRTAELLREDGVNARWMPKGYSAGNFRDLGLPRSGVCTFGTMWPSRRAMVARLRRRGVPLVDVSGPFSGLNERLNSYSAAVVCNMTGSAPFGKPGRGVARLFPSLVRTRPAVEPMIKTFEVAGAGCAPVIDYLDELEHLGFVEGETCLYYETFDEAADKLLSYDEERLRRIGQAAANLATSQHTWTHRAQRLVQLLDDALSRPLDGHGPS